MQSIEVTKPDDWHLHLRDGSVLPDLLNHTFSQFERAMIMPNLKSPIQTTAQARAYRERILEARPQGNAFQPLMTLYLRDTTSPDEIERAAESGVVYGCKLYPAGATTNSDSGVTSLKHLDGVFERMSDICMPLLIHGEVTNSSVDIFDRESVFIKEMLIPLMARHPKLRIVLEHITTRAAVEFVKNKGPNIAATITAHHLHCNRNHMLAGGIRPHLYCLPILKKEDDRRALVSAAISGNPKYFLGTDSAPHSTQTKETVCGCAGCYTAPSALSLYLEIFDKTNTLDRFEGFASCFGPDFYKLKRNTERIILIRKKWKTPELYAFGENFVRPFQAGEDRHWQVVK